MTAYLLRRLLLLVPTLFFILVINFAVLQFLPGGPIEQYIGVLENVQGGLVDRVLGGGEGGEVLEEGGAYHGARGLPPELLEELEVKFGLDLPIHQRFGRMLSNYLRFDFGDSFFSWQVGYGVDNRKASCFYFAWLVEHFDYLSGFNSVRDC